MASVRKSLAISFADKYSVMVVQFASTLILARLLTPEDIGIFSVGAVVVGFAHMLRDFGVANYIVQEKELTTERLRTAFGVTLIISWGAASILYACSGPISRFYDEPGVSNVIIILAVSFLFIPFSSTILGLLRREMKFGTLFWVNLLSAIAHTLTGVTLAFFGFGFESLAWATIASAATTVIIAIINRPDNAQFIPSFSEFRRIFSFGSYSSGSALAQEAGLSAPDLAIGRLLGFEALGYYSRAMGMISIFDKLVSSAISPIILPIFSKITRENGDLRQPYLLAHAYNSAISWPFFAFLGLMAFSVTRILYGPQWDAAVPILQVLCIAFALRSLSSFAYTVLISQGQVKKCFYIQIILQTPRIIATVLASFHSLFAVAIIQIIFYFFSFIVYHYFISEYVKSTLLELLVCTQKSFFICIICMIIPLVIFTSTNISSEVLPFTFLIALLSFIASWVVSVYLLKHPIKNDISRVIAFEYNRARIS